MPSRLSTTLILHTDELAGAHTRWPEDPTVRYVISRRRKSSTVITSRVRCSADAHCTTTDLSATRRCPLHSPTTSSFRSFPIPAHQPHYLQSDPASLAPSPCLLLTPALFFSLTESDYSNCTGGRHHHRKTGHRVAFCCFRAPPFHPRRHTQPAGGVRARATDQATPLSHIAKHRRLRNKQANPMDATFAWLNGGEKPAIVPYLLRQARHIQLLAA